MANAGLRMSKANLAGYILENITTKELERISSRDVKERKNGKKSRKYLKTAVSQKGFGFDSEVQKR